MFLFWQIHKKKKVPIAKSLSKPQMEPQEVSLSKHIYTNSHSKKQSHRGPHFRQCLCCHLIVLFIYSRNIQERTQNLPVVLYCNQTRCFYGISDINSIYLIYLKYHKYWGITTQSQNYCSSSETRIINRGPCFEVYSQATLGRSINTNAGTLSSSF